jgi:hypothetical protein
VCEKYNYRLDDFYRKSWKEGGLTIGQIYTLYDHSVERQNEKYKFMAALQGIDMTGKEGKEGKGKEEKTSKKTSTLEFQDPSAYEHMTDEEKNELTMRMKGGHLKAVSTSGFG